MKQKISSRNRTLTLSLKELEYYKKYLLHIKQKASLNDLLGKTIQQNIFEVVDFLPDQSIDLMFADPPYNLTKNFNGISFKKATIEDYNEYIESWLKKLIPKLKPNASVYLCGDWRTSTSIHLVGLKYFDVINRITWERDKGRGAKRNWKNCNEDIWFFANSKQYTFNVDDVKIKRKVIAPYKVNGVPKDWEKTKNGDFRVTSPSNNWTDITIPYWSMSENTDHPTQKPEKLLAKIILASSNPGDVVFDPFLGSGTTSVVAKKLKRNFFGVEINEEYACYAEKRLQLVDSDDSIQGYFDGVFWERNSLAMQKKSKKRHTKN